MHFRHLFRRKSIDMILAHAKNEQEAGHMMRKDLGVRDLTSFGIAAIIGAGIFSTIGNAAAYGGPAVSLLFVFSAIACGFSALCYAQFASSIPLSGSAYTYAYASFGELVAWIIGWDLIMEYAVGNIAVAISWSGYFCGLLSGFGIHIPDYLAIDYLSASRGFKEASELLAAGMPVADLPGELAEAWRAWTMAPALGGLRLIADVPAFAIVVFITWLVYRGIRESKRASNIMVLLKVAILLMVIAVGAFYVSPENWNPFAPNGIGGVLKGVSGVFFAYIGFDAISTTAEECKNPQRDLPRSMIYSLIITTVLYVAISLVLTGMVSYHLLGVSDPLAFVFDRLQLTRLSGIIALSAVIAMASVLLVFQVGQPRIWMSMSRDGLLPPVFAKLHPRYQTPAFSTIITGILVAVPTLFMNLTEVTDLTSIGTLFAFVLVSGGILILDGKKTPAGNLGRKGSGKFRVTYINSRYWLPVIWLGVFLILLKLDPEDLQALISFDRLPGETAWDVVKHKIPHAAFLIVAVSVTWIAVKKELSLIPALGLLTNFYLMSQLGITNWLRFLIWLVIGLVLYFVYGVYHSRLKTLS
ncbi:amino acid permease [Lentimicrobium sp.]|uniref:amino acid permease n=1 Tax=Lentimicrobium sp. TaxID=2034841 RepID=UPI002C124DA6|nr:amino acid permease [Lentimicrobium sp.]HPR26224.1 amino acid permease [Lentimicrobium sp.]